MNVTDKLINSNLELLYNSKNSSRFEIHTFIDDNGKELYSKSVSQNFSKYLEDEKLIEVTGAFCRITRKGIIISEKGGWLKHIEEEQEAKKSKVPSKTEKVKYQIFISSTFTDLKEERQAAVEAILKKGHIPAGMELFTAGDKSQWEVIKKWIDESYIYLLILGGRYGSIDNETGLSYTEMEYNYAIEKGKPFFALSLGNEILDKKPIEIIKDFDLKNPKYIAFKEKVTKKMCAFPKNNDQIKNEINHSLDTLIIDNKGIMQGWIKGTI